MRKQLLSMAVAAAAVVAASPASAYVIVSVTDTTTSVTTSCNTLLGGCGAGWTFTLGGNSASFAGSVGSFTLGLNSVLNTVSNSPGASDGAVLSTTWNNLFTSDATHTLLISTSSLDFTLPSGPLLTLSGSQSENSNAPTPGGGQSSFYYADTNNLGHTSGAGVTTTSAALVISKSSGGSVAPGVNFLRNASPFSLNQNTYITTPTGVGSAVNSLNGTTSLLVVNAVPEPMTTALVGIALLGVAATSRRKLIKK